MRYALLCYDCEDEIAALNSVEEKAMSRRCLEAARSLPPTIGCGDSIRLLPTSTAVTLRVDPKSRPLDGPYAQTREQLVGFWLVDCDGLDDAIMAARRIAEARGILCGALEIRPIAKFNMAAPNHVQR